MDLSTNPILFLNITLAGMSFSLLGTVLPEIAEAFNLTTSQASSLPLALFIGDFCSLFLIGFLLSRPRMILIAGTLALAAGSLAIGVLTSFSLAIKVCFFVFGIGTGVLATLPGMIASRLSPERAARSMNLLYAFFSAGVMATPLIGGALLSWQISYRGVFVGYGILVCLSTIFTAAAHLPCPDLGAGLALSSIRKLFSNHRTLFIVLAMMNLCYVGAETVPNAYVPKYLHDTFTSTTAFRGALMLSLFWGAITLGRFACAALLNRGVPPKLTLAALAVLSAACLLPAAWTGNRVAAEILFVSSGLFLSGMFPIIISYSGQLPPASAGTMFLMVMASGMLGASIVGRMVGVLADRFSFSAGMSLAVPLALLVFVLIPLLPRSEKLE